MKTPEEWDQELLSNPFKWKSSFHLIEDIQRDALSDRMANTTDQQELEMARSIADNERIRGDRLYDEMIQMRAKWHEARKHLRAANKGAERNAIALSLAMHRLHNLPTTKQ